KDVAAGQAVGALEIQRRDHVASQDAGLESWRVARDRPRGRVPEPLARRVPAMAASQTMRRVLDVGRHDMPSGWRQRGIRDRGNGKLDPWFLGKTAVLRRIEGALDRIDVAGEANPSRQGARLLIGVAR